MLRCAIKKWISVATIIVLVTIVSPSTGCASGDIAIEVSNSLIEITEAGIVDIDSEIIKIDQQFTETGEKLAALEQLLTPAMKWVEHQETVEKKPGSWKIQVAPEVLDQLKNERYQVNKLEFLTSLEESSSTIKITDLTTNTTYNGKALQDDLTSLKNTLEQKREVKLEARNLATSTIDSVLKYFTQWKTQKLNDTTYTISGAGLGWAEKLTKGNWNYHKDNGQMVPGDKQAHDLKAILSAR